MSIKDFQIISKLGEGAYSSVFKARRLIDQEFYAIKKVKLTSLSQKQKGNALNEVRILASFRHPNIVGYREAFMDDSSNSLCVVMEYLDGGDLSQRIAEQSKKGQNFTEQFIWTIFLQIVKGLEALHVANILHRDIKSANVFMTKSGVAKLGDMNVSKVARKGFGETQTGTPYYASPEVWKDEAYNRKSDMWSLGCVLYELVTLKTPFKAGDLEGLFKKVIRGSYNRIPANFSTDLAILIKSLLKVNPDQRPTCSEILQMQCSRKRLQGNLFLQPEEQSPRLLKTIRMTKDTDHNYLTDAMPKPNYSPLKYKEPERMKSLSTIEEERGKNLPELKKAIKKKIKETEAIKKKLEELLEYHDKMESPTRLNRSLDISRNESGRNSEVLQLPRLSKKRYLYA